MNAITSALKLNSKQMSKIFDTIASQLSQYFKRKKRKNNSSRLNADSYEESSGDREGSLEEEDTTKEESNPSSNSTFSKLQDAFSELLNNSKEDQNQRNDNKNKRIEKDSKEKKQSDSKKGKKIKSNSEEEKEVERDSKEKKQSDSKKEKKRERNSEEEKEVERDSKEKKQSDPKKGKKMKSDSEVEKEKEEDSKEQEQNEKDDSQENQSHSKKVKVIDSREESQQSMEHNRKLDGIAWSSDNNDNASARHSKKLQKAKKIMQNLLFSKPEKKDEDMENATKKDNDKDFKDDKKKDRQEDIQKVNMKDSKEDKKKDYATRSIQSKDELQLEVLPVSASAENEVNKLSSPAESVETLEEKVKKEDTKNDKEKNSKKFNKNESKKNDTKSNQSEDNINVELLSSSSEMEVNELSDLLVPASYTTSSLAPAPHSESKSSSSTLWRGQCFMDNPKRILPSRAPVEGGLTIEKCKKLCFEERNYSYAGVQNGDECYCGNNLPNTPAPDAECSVPCSGDEAQMCGGWFRMNIYPNQRLLDNKI